MIIFDFIVHIYNIYRENIHLKNNEILVCTKKEQVNIMVGFGAATLPQITSIISNIFPAGLNRFF